MEPISLGLGDFCLRPWRVGDEPALVRYANNPRVSENLRDHFPYPYTPADARDWVERARKQREPATSLAIASPSEAVGGIGLVLLEDICRRSAEIGYWLGEPFWGRGLATRAVTAMTAYGFEHFDLARIGAWIFEGNQASARVLEKAGYFFEGTIRLAATKRGRTLDLLSYGIVRADRRLA